MCGKVCVSVCQIFLELERERDYWVPNLSRFLSLPAKCTSFDHFWRERFSCGHKRAKTSEAQKTKQARDDALVKSTSLFPRLKHDDVCDAFQQNLGDARVRRGQETTTKFARRPRDDHQSGRERLAENNRRKRRRDEEISVERSPTGGYSRHV